MQIAAITRYKHGGLHLALKRLGWTQTELAQRAGVSQHRIGKIINLQARPTREVAEAIQRALGEGGEYLDVTEQWPESFEGLKQSAHREEILDVPMENLLGCREAMLLPAPDRQASDELTEAMDRALSELSPRERRVIEARFYEGKTVAAAAKELGTCTQTIVEAERRALRRLRHPCRLKNITPFAGAFLTKDQPEEEPEDDRTIDL